MRKVKHAGAGQLGVWEPSAVEPGLNVLAAALCSRGLLKVQTAEVAVPHAPKIRLGGQERWFLEQLSSWQAMPAAPASMTNSAFCRGSSALKPSGRLLRLLTSARRV